MVASVNLGEPHYVTERSSEQFFCNGSCPRFSTYKICQHVAAAQDSGIREYSSTLYVGMARKKMAAHTFQLQVMT